MKETKRPNIICPMCKKVMIDNLYPEHCRKLHPKEYGNPVTIFIPWGNK